MESNYSPCNPFRGEPLYIVSFRVCGVLFPSDPVNAANLVSLTLELSKKDIPFTVAHA